VKRRFELLGSDGQPRSRTRPGTLGGHRGTKIYGKLDCAAALRALARGGYARHRVFFASAGDARGAGFRPCAVCLPAEYRKWKAARAPRGA
jgi:methylphosphotriester-DNA--protein-cysteine methyltransferase